MSKKSILRGALIAIISIASVLSLSGVANASATVTRFTFSFTETFADAPPECMPVVKSGVTSATDTGSGQVTETDNGFAFHGSDTFAYRTDFTDGSYLAGVAYGHSFDQAAPGRSGQRQATRAAGSPRLTAHPRRFPS
jgi:hypothetical protein